MPILIYWGTHQSCPLSLLLFNLSLDPLLRHLQTNIPFQGNSIDSRQLKLLAFVDDILLYISNPSASLPAILADIGLPNQ